MPTKAALVARVAELEAELAGRRGRCESALLASLPAVAERTVWVEARAQVALALARQLDEAGSGGVSEGPPPNVSAMARELGACIERLELELASSDDSGFFDGVDDAPAVGHSPPP